jgi:hypothetical protein
LGIADAKDLSGGIVSQRPGRQRDRSAERFEVPRRNIDDETSDLATPHRFELRGQNLDMPVPQEPRVRIEFVEASLDEGDEVLPQHRLVFGRGEDLVSRNWLIH